MDWNWINWINWTNKRYAAHLAAQFENAKSAGGIINAKESRKNKCEMKNMVVMVGSAVMMMLAFAAPPLRD